VLRTLIKPVYLGLRGFLIRVFIRSGPPPRIPEQVRSLLVIADRRLGDLCLAIPAIQCLRDAYPNATLAVLAPAYLHPLVQWACRPNMMLDWTETAKAESQGWDLATDYDLKSARLARATNAPVRIGFDAYGKGRYFNIPLSWKPAQHMAETYAQVLAPLGVAFRPPPLPRVIPAEPLPGVHRHRVVVHPGAHHQTQRWPVDYFAELIRRIRGGGESCLVVGAEDERGMVETIAKLAGDGAEAAIAADVLQLAATFRMSEVVICNNSGPLHLASLLGVPTLSFMGPTDKTRWSPLGENNVVLRRDALPCIGCNSGHCRIGTHACMQEISPDDALAGYLRLRLT
jgi:ADP-heptose:LPS heptosyltransferase